MHSRGLRLGTMLFFLSSASGAAAPGKAPRPRVPVTLRFVLPFTEHTLVNGGDRTDSTGLGIAVGVLVGGVWAAELGAAGRSSGRFIVRAATVRVGVSPTLVDHGNEEGGYTINAGPWLGYRNEVRSASDDGYDPREEIHAASGALRLFFTRWWNNGGGLELSLGAGLVVPVARSASETWGYRVARSADYRHGVDLGGTVGWSF